MYIYLSTLSKIRQLYDNFRKFDHYLYIKLIIYNIFSKIRPITERDIIYFTGVYKYDYYNTIFNSHINY